MAINTSTITQLISDFRVLSEKDSITPESLGTLLQQLANLIHNAAADSDFSEVVKALSKVPTALVGLSQGTPNKNNILLNIIQSDLEKGILSTKYDAVVIQQATTERAGAMRAEHVVDLNNTRDGLRELSAEHRDLQNRVGDLVTTVSNQGMNINKVTQQARDNAQDISNVFDFANEASEEIAGLQENVHQNGLAISGIKKITDCPKIAAEVVSGNLQIVNYDYYIKNGYGAFVFRFTTKRNRACLENQPDKRRGQKHKGWHVIGGIPDNVIFDSNGFAKFRTSPLDEWHSLKDAPISHSLEPEYVVGVKGEGEGRYVPWGRKRICLRNDRMKYMMRRFRFAIGFAKAYERDVYSISPAKLVSNLAEFSVIFDPSSDKFHFGE